MGKQNQHWEMKIRSGNYHELSKNITLYLKDIHLLKMKTHQPGKLEFIHSYQN